MPLAPRNPLRYRQQLRAIKNSHTGCEILRNAGGPVTSIKLGPRFLVPAIVVVTSPQGARDLLGRNHEFVDRGALPFMVDLRHLIGGNLANLPYAEWLPRRRALQPVFTKQHVPQFAGHMAGAADHVLRSWPDGGVVDLNAACHMLTLRALGRSVLGLDLDDNADAMGRAMHFAMKWVADRSTAPVRAPRWLPTPAQRRARAANSALHRLAAEILQVCRADPDRDAPLVRALMATNDPTTGQTLSDGQIRDELVIFMLAGQDTTATTLTYALWALGHHPELQRRVAAEAAAVGDRPITPADVDELGYTIQVLHEALRLCPPGANTARMILQDCEVDGYRVQAGTYAIVGIYAMHRDPALWDNPLSFDPDRFTPDNARGRDRWQYLPFGGGQRSCIGAHFAMLEATVALATIVRAMEIRSLGDQFPLSLPFTLVANGPIRARVGPRI